MFEFREKSFYALFDNINLKMFPLKNRHRKHCYFRIFLKIGSVDGGLDGKGITGCFDEDLF